MDAKKLFLDHFEKIALAIAGIVLAAFILTTLVQAQPADKFRGDVDRANRAIAAKIELAKNNAPQPPALPGAREVEGALSGGGADAAKLPDWLVHKKPVIATRTEGVEVPEPKHFAPTVEAPKSDLGQIGIRWAEHSGNHLVKIDRYDVLRAEGTEPKT